MREQELSIARKVAVARRELQVALVDQREYFAQRRQRADWIDAASQRRTLLAAGHPFGNQSPPLIQQNFEKQHSTPTKPSADIELTPEKWVERILNRDNTRIAGIIVWTTRRTKQPIKFEVKG